MPFKIIAKNGTDVFSFQSAATGPTLLELLHHEKVPIRSSCMGRGTCQQCRIKVTSGFAPVSGQDRKFFSSTQLSEGWRLSCQIRPKASLEFSFPQRFSMASHLNQIRSPTSPWTVLFDVGTTGLEMWAVDQEGVWAGLQQTNEQILMGADVMTRLEYGQKHGLESLHQRLVHQAMSMLDLFAMNSGTVPPLGEVWAAGNSAMAAFLHRSPIDQLAVAPFQPDSLEGKSLILGRWNLRSLPLLYSFVGGDLFADAFFLWNEAQENPQASPKTLSKPLMEPWILLDIGTNSEILFWTGTQLIVSSTPAGPAFEGSNISIGMRAERGAIIDPHWNTSKSRWDFQVIGNDIPKGICGSALIQCVQELIAHGFIKPDGEVVLSENLALTSDLGLIQADIREFQLAKSAIATGVELVLAESKNRPKQMYLAGAFGENIPLKAARDLGLLLDLPTKSLGNACLKGLQSWSNASPQRRQEFETWLNDVKAPLDLALHPRFQERFVENLHLQTT